MIAIRSALFLFGQIVSAVVIFGLVIFCLPFHGLRDRVISSWARFNIWTLKWLCRIDIRVSGRENIPDQPVVIVSNHQSAWETLYFQLLFPPLSFVLKRQLLWIPVFGWGLAAQKPIAIDRNQKKRALDQLISQGAERLAEGRWLVIYPEGTRRPPEQPGKFQIGGAMIAAKTVAPILPIAHNAGVLWPKQSFLKYPGTIDIVIGEMMSTEGLRAREINERGEQWIKDTLATLPDTRGERA